MSKKINFLVRVVVFSLITTFFISCDREFSDIGANIVGDNHYGLLCDSTSTVIAYNQTLGPVQTNNLPINSIGYYNNPVFGKTTACFLTKLQMNDGSLYVYDKANVSIDSVYLYVPYYSTYVSTDSDSGDSTYTLDSIQGSNPIKLSVYRSNFQLNDYDPLTGFQQKQKYYSDQQSDVEFLTPMVSRLNNSSDATQNDNFTFNSSQIKFFETTTDGSGNVTVTSTVRTRLAPGMYMDLDKTPFLNDILKTSNDNLINNSVFKDYYKGLYFKVEANANSANQGSLARMNFAQGKITIVYHDATSSTDATSLKRTITLNMTGNCLNTLNNEFVNPVTPDVTNGDSELYLKGGDGSMAVIDLFGKEDVRKYVDGVSVSGSNGVPDELDDLRNPANGQLPMVNDASLTFYVKQNAMTGAPEPNRVYLYDLNNNRPIVDYYYDNTNGITPKYNKYVHGGILVKSDGTLVNVANGDRGYKYSVKLTNHIRNLIKNDSTNVRLGLVVTESIMSASEVYLKNPFPFTDDSSSKAVKYFPMMSVANPFGTILYGSKQGTDNPDSKRIKLRIYYTKPE